ncbi:hypothetical protein IAG25_35635 [Caballeronia sp. EK]|uniref:hypothetical protein n=1 Tax=Caballeronia sp. EK TaxID=2767469 RepID=UPI001655CE4F|nr:hypothetical protein [Caballeronia sp. EK]MBC8642140.1 hypothetical protein [Caballeronia sp. EK]
MERMQHEGHPPRTEGDDMRAILAALNKLTVDFGLRHVENTSSLAVLEKDLKVVKELVDDLAKGFPGGDPDGHRRAHEAQIRKAEARAKFYEDLRSKLVERGLWALILFIGVALWQYFKVRVTQ